MTTSPTIPDTGRFEPATPSRNGSRPQIDDTGVDASPTRSRRRWIRYGVLALVALGVAIAAFLYDPRRLIEDDDVAVESAPRDTAEVAVRDLADDYEADGSLVFSGSSTATYVGSGGVVTEIVAPGTTIERGDVLWRVNDEPTVALVGTIPHYRALGVDATGPDVEQLEANLVLLGYDPDRTVTVDETYTANTGAMVERWQADIGATVTGRVSADAVVIVDGLVRAGGVALDPGASAIADAPMLDLSSLDRIVEFTVAPSERETLAVGDTVDVRLPDRSTVAATVTERTILDNGGIAVVAATTDPVTYAVDTVPATVTWDVPTGTNVMTVPAASLFRTDSGTYYVEVVESDARTTRLVSVTPGRSSGSTVEVTGDVAEGDVVVAP